METTWAEIIDGRGFSALEKTLSDLGLESRVCAVRDTRAVTKADMVRNDACPGIRVEPDTFKVWVDGDEVVPDPATSLPLAQRYSLF